MRGAEVVERLAQALEQQDADGLDRVLSANSEWHIGGDGPLSGFYRGAAIRGLWEELWSATHATMTIEGADVCSSEHHHVLLYLATASREERRLSSHEAVVAAVDGGRIVRAFHYFFDQQGTSEFWRGITPPS